MERFRGDHSEIYQGDIQRLSAVASPAHMKENELVQIFRANKFNLRLASYSYELLISYLQDNHLMLILKIVNQYLNIQVYAGKPQDEEEDGDPSAIITGYTVSAVNTINKADVLWGSFDTSQQVKDAVAAEAKRKAAAAVTVAPSVWNMSQF